MRVKRKGQVTIPAPLRTKLGLSEGSFVEVEEHSQGLLLRPVPPPEPGKVVGRTAYRRLLRQLEGLRARWR